MKRFEEFVLAFLLISLLGYHLIPYHDVAPDVQPYVQEFQVKMWDRCSPEQVRSSWQMSANVRDEVSWFNKETVGVCHYRLLGFDVTLRKDFWNYLDDTGRRQLVYHELLHCYLNVEHEDGTIMDAYSYPFTAETIDKQVNYFIDRACKK
jgi:hypothetical protein